MNLNILKPLRGLKLGGTYFSIDMKALTGKKVQYILQNCLLIHVF